ncbi:MAG TPA: YhbY family RNA-binding protein [Thermoanaerobaculia bacterium]|nr:YhbY family RNA-binding protein [Thermoanaerobaculia bacterium]
MTTAALTASQRRQLKARAHPLSPVVQVGRGGVSEAFVAELDRALESHELVKVRLRGEREERAAQLSGVTARLDCTVVGTVGAVAILYRASEDGDGATAERE